MAEKQISNNRIFSFISKEIVVSVVASSLLLGLSGLYAMGQQAERIENLEQTQTRRHEEQKQVNAKTQEKLESMNVTLSTVALDTERTREDVSEIKEVLKEWASQR